MFHCFTTADDMSQPGGVLPGLKCRLSRSTVLAATQTAMDGHHLNMFQQKITLQLSNRSKKRLFPLAWTTCMNINVTFFIIEAENQ